MTDFALALGAGGARGIAHIHAIKALDDLGVRPSVIAGTSIGALMGAAYASGMSGQDIDDFIEDRIQNRLVLLSQIFRIRPESVWQFLADGGPRIGELNLERILSVFLPDTICKEFSSLSIPLRVIATDFSGERDRSFEEGPLLSALAASASIPAVFLPVKIEGFYFIDGSATNPCPVDWVQDAADRVIAIDVAGGATVPRGEKPGKLDVLYGANQIMQRTMVDLNAARFPNTVLLKAPVAQFRPLDFLRSREILRESDALYEQTKRAIAGCLDGKSRDLSVKRPAQVKKQDAVNGEIMNSMERGGQ